MHSHDHGDVGSVRLATPNQIQIINIPPHHVGLGPAAVHQVVEDVRWVPELGVQLGLGLRFALVELGVLLFG